MSDSANYLEGSNGAADPAGPKLGRVEVLPPRGNRRQGGRMSRGLRSWARKNFSRKQLLTALKTMLWVAPLTLLIWIYAEREQQYTPPPVTIPIEITTNDPNRVVTLRRPSPEEPWVIARITGPRSGVEAVMHSWDPSFGGGPVRIEIDRKLGTGDNRIDASVIGNDPRFASHGVSVSGAQPAWLDVVIDPIVEMQADVKAVNVPPNAGSVTFTPSSVKVRGPKRVLDEAAATGKLRADADLAHSDLTPANLPDRTIILPNVTLSLPINSHDVSIVGSSVAKAEVNLKTGKELTLAVVPVEVATTKAIMDGYKLMYEPTLRDVTVVGPEDKIALLSDANPDSSTYKKAIFEVTGDDINSLAATGSKTVQVEFRLPPGVQYKSGPNTINFIWERRNPE
jgi:hypothetical protein